MCDCIAVGSTVPSDGRTQGRSSMGKHVNQAVNQNKAQLLMHLDQVASSQLEAVSSAYESYSGTGWRRMGELWFGVDQ